jgi:hypothetical protein
MAAELEKGTRRSGTLESFELPESFSSLVSSLADEAQIYAEKEKLPKNF